MMTVRICCSWNRFRCGRRSTAACCCSSGAGCGGWRSGRCSARGGASGAGSSCWGGSEDSAALIVTLAWTAVHAFFITRTACNINFEWIGANIFATSIKGFATIQTFIPTLLRPIATYFILVVIVLKARVINAHAKVGFISTGTAIETIRMARTEFQSFCMSTIAIGLANCISVTGLMLFY